MNISTIDLAILLAYLVGITGLGLLSVRKRKLTGDVYFLAGRSLRWPVVGAALFAANISTIHLVGLAEGGYKHGLVIGNFEWMATFTLVLLALVFVPFYSSAGLSTLPEFLERRYSPAARTILACMAIASALFVHIGISLYSGAAVVREFFGLDENASILMISLVTVVYTVLGGLRAVVVTETIQTVILLVGAVVITILAVLALPAAGVRSIAELREAVKPDQLSMLQATNPDGYAWYAILLGYPVLGVWYWCTDQTIVQRVLGARSQRDAQNGALFAGLLKIFPVFLMVLPGVLGWVLYKDIVGADSKQIYPVMINRLVPVGLKGLIGAGLLAALMSTISAALNSIGTLVAIDIVKRVRPATSDAAQVRIGAASAIAVMLLAMAWSTQAGRFGSIFEAINKVPAQFLAPPITAVFVWGVFWRRGTRQAALWTLILGFSLGFVVFLVDLPAFGSTQWITDAGRGLGIPFMMQAWWGFCLCSSIYVVASLLSPRPDPSRLEGVTWPNPLQVILRGRLEGLGDPRVLAAVLLAVVAVLYCIFR